ncbi:MAG: YciI family protein [Nitrososphaerales archaeon]
MIVIETLSHKTTPPSDMIKRHVDFLRDKGSKRNIMIAGPFADGKGGCILWRVDSLREAERIAKEDPFFKEANSDFTLREWEIDFDYTMKPPVISC